MEQIRNLARDPELVRRVFEEASMQQKALIPKLEAERKRLLRDKQARGKEIRRLVGAIGAGTKPSTAMTERLAELEGVVARIERLVREIDSELDSLRENSVNPDDVALRLAEFDGVWATLYPTERTQMVYSLIDRVNHCVRGEVTIAFRSVSGGA